MSIGLESRFQQISQGYWGARFWDWFQIVRIVFIRGAYLEDVETKFLILDRWVAFILVLLMISLTRTIFINIKLLNFGWEKICGITIFELESGCFLINLSFQNLLIWLHHLWCFLRKVIFKSQIFLVTWFKSAKCQRGFTLQVCYKRFRMVFEVI